MSKVNIAILVLVAIACGAPTAVSDQHCQGKPDDVAVLEVVFKELIVPRLKPGVVLLETESVAPQFPATLSQVEDQKAIIERIEKEPQPDESEFAAAFFEVPRGIDLDLGDHRLITVRMVNRAFDREGCAMPEIAVEGREIVGFEEVEFPSPWEFWDFVREKYKPLGGLVSLALPAYSEDGTEAVTSYSRSHGPVAGMGETVFLRLIDGTWTIIWHDTTFVS